MYKKGLNILLIEDNPGDARLISEVLKMENSFEFSLVHARTFSEGCEKLRTSAFEIILLDFALPDSSGFESIAEIKRLTPDTPIVLLTGLDDEKTAVSALQSGAQDYLTKGHLDSRLLVRSLRHAIERTRAETALRKAKDELEVRVQQRTTDLLVANNTISASNTLLKLLLQTFSRKEYLDAVLELFENWSACKYSGVRILDDRGNIPYSSYRGFSAEFCNQEAAMSVKSDTCVCARIINRRPRQQELSFISPGSSFYCSNFIEFVNSLREQEKVGYLSGCIQSGFQSMAVIPIRYQNKVIGVFHFADKAEGRISPKRIEFMESMMPIVGEAIHRYRIEEDRTRLMAAAESANDALVITDTSGKIQYANPAFERITGYSIEETVGHDLHILDSGSHDESLYQIIRDRLGRGLTWNGRLVSKKKDGTFYHEECTIAPVKDQSGRISNYIAVRRDVTEKMRLESIAEAVNTMNNIGYVFSGIRHEIGNPINSMKMALNLLYVNLSNYSEQTIQEYLERILNELSRVEYLLQSLKTFNMYETPELQNIRVREFLEKFVSLSKRDYEKKGVAISSSVEPDAECCYADPRALQQVLLNLLTNSIDACEGRENPRISITVSRSSRMIRIGISDNGCGIAEEQQRNIFKPFYTTKSDGTGLGLVITKKMLAKMNASIEVTSRINEGTEMCILIPGGSNGN